MELRPQLGKGLVVFICFLFIILANDMFFPDSFIIPEYRPVSAERLLENPEDFEGVKVSFEVIVLEVTDNITESKYLVKTEENVDLEIQYSLGPVHVGDDVLLRGISYLHAEGYIEVTELYVTDPVGPVIKSIPGIVSLVILFFLVFSFDYQKLAFIPRRNRYA